MITLTELQPYIQELVYGDKEPSLVLALWFSALSQQQCLEKNQVGACIMKKYLDQPLPDEPERLAQELLTYGVKTNGKILRALYYTQALNDSGDLDILADWNKRDILSQITWRKRAYELYHPLINGKRTGMGMGYKCLSMALFLLMPFDCQLVPVDRHHMHRLGQKNNAPTSYSNYLSLENQLFREKQEAGMTMINLSTYAWLKWQD